jgi:PAS domain S-box-containing protein
VSSQLVVIVDDSITNLKIQERLASSLGGPIVAKSFVDPDAALLFCSENCPDLVLLAAASAQGEAAELICRLREQAGCANVPVIVVGAQDDFDCIARAREAGAGDHLLIPVDHRDFRIRARGQLLGQRAPPRAGDEIAPVDEWPVDERPVDKRPVDKRPVGEPASEEPPGEAGRRYPEGSRQAYETLLRLIDVIPRMICVTGRDGRYLLVNRLFASFVGVAASRLNGKRPAEAHGGPLARILMESDERLLAGTAVPSSAEEEEIVDRDGNPCVLLTSKAMFHAGDGDEPMVVTVFVDITGRKRTERDLHASKDQAELANRSKTEFVANMSHELRTPLNAIIGFSQVIAGEMLGPVGTAKYVGYARDILSSAEHLLGLINDILDVSKLEAGKLDLAEEVIDPAKTVADLVQLAEAKARVSEIGVAIRREGVIAPLRADARKLKQIVLNLLVNAIKFSHPGGKVEIVLRNADGALAIAVIDHGIGMDGVEVDLAMTRFGQVASTWTRKHDGTGLGLPLAIGLTELHGGNLTIHSTKGVGTTVTVSFPRERSQLVPQPGPQPVSGAIRAVRRS